MGAEREGVSATERTTLLLYLAHALVGEGKPTPFQEAVRAFLARHSLDPGQVGAAIEELVRICLSEGKGERPPPLPRELGSPGLAELTGKKPRASGPIMPWRFGTPSVSPWRAVQRYHGDDGSRRVRSARASRLLPRSAHRVILCLVRIDWLPIAGPIV